MDELTRQEVDAKIAATRAGFDARFANLESAMKIGFAEIRADMDRMRSDVHKGITDILKWAIGFTVAALTILTFELNYASSRVAAPVATTAPAPIVINVPQAVPHPAPAPAAPQRPESG